MRRMGSVRSLYEEAGLFANVRLEPIDRLHIAMGVRMSFDRLRQGQISFHNNGVITPYAAMSYDLRRDLAAYISYADIYQMQSGTLAKTLRAVAPHQGETFEVGVKAAPLDGRLNASLALHDSVQSNQTVLDPTTPGQGIQGCCFIPVGSQAECGAGSGDRRRGFARLAGTKRLYLHTYNTNGYSAALRAKLAAEGVDTQAVASLQPKNQFKIWSSYSIDKH
jgi:outer-membrane receptor for ferric coprogen and ferric-rhodotorulic acid